MFRSHDKDMSGFISKDDVLCMLLGADKVRAELDLTQVQKGASPYISSTSADFTIAKSWLDVVPTKI